MDDPLALEAPSGRPAAAKPQSWWIEKFKRRGYQIDEGVTAQ